MRILIIGDYPLFYGGVTNYTRPLAQELSKEHDVFYLYNSTRTGNNSFFSRKRLVKRNIKGCDFECVELINGDALYFNYSNLDKDINNWFDNILMKYINEIKPDIVHIHEIFGFSSSIINIIHKMKIKVYVTVHEYWWLCPHRVMVDFNRNICEGPSDFKKCSFCIDKRKMRKSYTIIKTISKIKNDFPIICKYLSKIKTEFARKKKLTNTIENINCLNIKWEYYKHSNLEKQLINRFNSNIKALNNCDKIIAVSSDVKNILTKYGVVSNNIIIQHIGSTIAEKTIEHTKLIEPNKIVFGFIGGVGYYKGVHQLVDAFCNLPYDLKLKSHLKIYGKYSESYYNAIYNDILTNKEDQERVTFYGKFTPNDIPKITNEIDISVLPSLCADTAPQTIFESFSCGLPIIAPKIGGFPDFISDMSNGLLYEASSVDDLKRKLITIIENPQLIKVFKSNLPTLKSIKENVKELIITYKSL